MSNNHKTGNVNNIEYHAYACPTSPARTTSFQPQLKCIPYPVNSILFTIVYSCNV